jgi:hypothetical protein
MSQDSSVSLSVGVSDFKARLDYCEDPARSCENVDFIFPAQTKRSTVSLVSLNYFEIFLNSM